MAARRSSLEKESKKLIHCLTGFDEHDENFELCHKFVESNFKFHRFLDVDSHKMTRAIKGMSEKFTIHAQDTKAEAFDRLVADFLESPVYEDRDKGKTDTHYAILSLLLTLAESPTLTDYRETHKDIAEEEKDSFDWKAYLLEGEDSNNGPYPDSPVWSSDEEDIDIEPHDSTVHPSDSLHDATVQRSVMSLLDDEVVVMETEPSAEQWLQSNVMVQYWKGCCEIDVSSNRSSTLSLDWEHCLSASNPLHVPSDLIYLTEYQVVREVLWMLGGTQASFLFTLESGKLVVRDNIRVTHLTQGSLHKLLEELAPYGTLVWKLNHFCHTVFSGQQYWGQQSSAAPSECTESLAASAAPSECSESQTTSAAPSESAGSRGPSSESTETQSTSAAPSECPEAIGVSQTYQAFAVAVADNIQKFRKKLCQLEMAAKKGDTSLTLLVVLKTLAESFSELQLLDTIFTRGVEACCSSTSNSQRAAHLLGVIYDTLVAYDTLGQEDTRLVSLVLLLWLKSCRPYLDIVDSWISLGCLRDPKQEFIIQRNTKAKSLDENFWETAFTFHCAATMEQTGSSAPGSTDGALDPDSKLKKTPGFLLPVLEQLILAGKSMEMLQNLGRLKDVVEDKVPLGQKRKTLYDTFCECLVQELGDSSDPVTSETLASDLLTSVTLIPELSSLGVTDPFLQLNFQQMSEPPEQKMFKELEEKDKQMNSMLQHLNLDKLSSVEVLLHKCLYPTILSKSEKICSCLLRILKEEYHLLDYFSAIRRYYLMESGDVMYEFYTEVFEKLRLQEAWQDVSSLNIILQEILHDRQTQDEDRLTVSVAELPVTTKERAPVNATDGLTLHYKVDWPVNIILHSRCMKAYSTVFTFLLQIKRVKHSLDRLRFNDLERDDSEDFLAYLGGGDQMNSAETTVTEETSRPQLVHRMCVFRLRLLHFVNSLHNYIMTRILHSTGLEFQAELASARDIDQLIRVHNKYVVTLHTRCLLHGKVKFIKDIVMQVLNLTLRFQQCWLQGADKISMRTLQQLEDKFSKCITFLSSFLGNFISKGAFPHLESLAFALVTSSQAAKS